MFEVDVQRTLADLRTLAGFGRFESGVNRRALTAEDVEARAWLLERMQAAGLEAWIDGIGSVFGRTPARDRYILIGSHTDTVPRGGWLDGAMGVVFGLEIARALAAAGGATDIGVEVVSFNDEEGRFSGLLGSSVFTGSKSATEAAELRADDGTRLDEALEAAGYAGRPVEALDPSRDIAYLEAHIEQGPVLEAHGDRLGVVTGIVGVERGRVQFLGQADHAGTTPMAMRRDAAAALYDFAVEFAKFCRGRGGPATVWNLGQVHLDPGAYNVVTREAEIHVEYRDGSPEMLAQMRSAVAELAAASAARHNVSSRFTPGVRTAPAVMDPGLMERIEAAAARLGVSHRRMPSGAGHDAMLFASRIPTAMLFVPSIGGRSHDVAEDTSENDIAVGLEVLRELVIDLLENGLHASSGAADAG